MTWQKKARCAAPDVDRTWFFPKRGDHVSIKKALATCAECPVRIECLDYASDNEDYGIWGGQVFRLDAHEGHVYTATKYRRLRIDDRAAILARWRSGEGLVELADEYGVSKSRLISLIAGAA